MAALKAVERITKAECFAQLPPEWPTDPLPDIQAAINPTREKVVILDDDPTGTQTVHHLPVLTHGAAEALQAELANDLPAFYFLTNSRSLPLPAAQALNTEIGLNLAEAARQVGRKLVVISRSDSTLRGHFPGEVDALATALGGRFQATLLIPAFFAGGRYTIDDIHYVAEGEWLVPVGQTEFARDAVFGYQASNLRYWVQEKTDGRIVAEAVASISIEDIRYGGPEQVTRRLLDLPSGSVCIVNAAHDQDLAVVALGLIHAEAQGGRYLYRTAASIVPWRIGLASQPLLTHAELDLPASGGGLVIVGSYVPKTSSQVNALFAQPNIFSVEVQVSALLDEQKRRTEIQRTAEQAERALSQNREVMIFTSRQLITGASTENNLSIGQRTSSGLVEILKRLAVRPRYLLTKGGITSSDIATQALGVKRAWVLGQILPGVPVWQLGPESRHPGLIYIVFPGNVGGPQALVEIVMALRS